MPKFKRNKKREEKSGMKESSTTRENARLVLKESSKCLLKFFSDDASAFPLFRHFILTTLNAIISENCPYISRIASANKTASRFQTARFNWMPRTNTVPVARRLFRLTKELGGRDRRALQIIKTDNRANVENSRIEWSQSLVCIFSAANEKKSPMHFSRVSSALIISRISCHI